jgi:hypothetical protein
MSLEKRVSALEAAAGAGDPSHGKPWHSVTVREGQSLADAVRAYGIEKIGEHDNLIVRGIVSPKFDEQGIMIPIRPGKDVGLRHGSWRAQLGLCRAEFEARQSPDRRLDPPADIGPGPC